MSLELTTKGLYELGERIEKASKELKVKKRAMYEKLGPVVLQDVRIQIGMKLGDYHGRIKSWQEYQVGSKGGYVAVRPIKGEVGIAAKSGKVTKKRPGAVTNYLESGHRIRSPSGNAKQKQRRRINVGYVKGYYFYRAAKKEIERNAQEYAEDMIQQVANELEG